MKKVLMIAIVLVTFLLSGCQKENKQWKMLETNVEEGILDDTTFSLNDLLIDGHPILEMCPFWNMNWEVLKENSPAIEDTYFDSFPGTPDMRLEYAESEGITYVIYDNSISAIILTDNTYGIHAGIRVGDIMTQTMIEEYHLKYFGKNEVDGNTTINTHPERKCSQKLEYDSVFSGTTFISQEESDSLMEEFLENISAEKQSFQSNELGIAVSFYVKEGVIMGICIERIV